MLIMLRSSYTADSNNHCSCDERLLSTELYFEEHSPTEICLQLFTEIFARSKAGIVGSNPTQGMDVSMCVYSVFVLFCI
jgi:hypothetical protein